MAIKAKNDPLIQDLLQDSQYEILETGVILKNGVEVGYTKKTEARVRGKGYRYISYRGFELKVHRIIYAKFNGELCPKKVVHHDDDDTMNNHKVNLKLVTQYQNMQFKQVLIESLEEDLPF